MATAFFRHVSLVNKTQQKRKKVKPRQKIVTNPAPEDPIKKPKKPAAIEPNNGKKTNVKYIFEPNIYKKQGEK